MRRIIGITCALCVLGLISYLYLHQAPEPPGSGGAATTPAATPSASFYQKKVDGAKTVVVFVHGVLGDGTNTWRKGNAYWPKMMADDADFVDSSIYVFQYPSSMWATLAIDELADNMRLYLSGQGVSDHDNIVFLAHSMGGLIVRAFLLKYRPISSKTGFVYFFSTPTNGSEIASLAALLSSTPQFSKMPPLRSADYLADQTRSWLAAELGIPSYCAYEKRATYGFEIVTQASATALCTKRVDPIDADHLDIVKPQGVNDASYLAFKSAFKEQQAAAPKNRASNSVTPTIKVNIEAPQNDATFPEDYQVALVGRAFDPDNGDLVGADLTWSTSQGLSIGSGRAVSTRNLPVGRHRIVLTATNKEGQNGRSSVDIDIKKAGTTLDKLAEVPLASRCGAVAWADGVLAVTNVDDTDHSREALTLLSIADPAKPTVVARIPMPFPERLVFRNRLLHAVSAAGELRTFDTSAGSLEEVGKAFRARSELGSILEAASSGNLLALRGLSGAVEIVDVGDPAAPRHSSWWTGQGQGGLGFYKDVLLVPRRFAGFKVHGGLADEVPTLMGELPGRTDEFSTNVEVLGDFAFVGSWAGNLRVVYMAEPAKPKLMGSLGGTGNAFRIALDGEKLFVAGLAEGLQILDVSTPSAPRYDSAFGHFGSVTDVVAKPDIVAVCADDKVSLHRRSSNQFVRKR